MLEKKEHPLISVIVPVYKVEKYLDRCISSIVSQTYHNLEIILVDDGSPDCCPQMCDRWARQDERIQVIHQKNKGLSEARNVALGTCIGEYILFVDSDDWIAPDLCEKVSEKIKNTGADVVVFGYRRSLANTYKTISDRRLFGDSRMINGKEAVSMLVNDELNFAVWTRIYRKYLFSDIRFPEGKYFEDVPVSYQVMKKAEKVYLWNKDFYYYEKRCDSIIEAEDQERMKDLLENELWSKEFVLQYYPEYAEAYKKRIGRVAYTICYIAGQGAATERAASILKNQEMCIAEQKAKLFIEQETVFWLLVNLRRWLKSTIFGKWIWKIKWMLIFEIKGRRIKEE